MSLIIIGSIIYSDHIIYGLKIFLLTKQIPLDLVYEPWVDQSKIQGSDIINCIHGGACPPGVTYYDYVSSSTVTTTNAPIIPAPEPVLQVQTTPLVEKKSAFLASVVGFKTIYSDGSIVQNLLPSGNKYSIKLVEAS